MRGKPSDLLIRLGRLTDRQRMTLGQYATRWLLKAVLFAGVIPIAVVLDGHYAAQRSANVCSDFNAARQGGVWDCSIGRRVGGWHPPGSGLILPLEKDNQ